MRVTGGNGPFTRAGLGFSHVAVAYRAPARSRPHGVAYCRRAGRHRASLPVFLRRRVRAGNHQGTPRGRRVRAQTQALFRPRRAGDRPAFCRLPDAVTDRSDERRAAARYPGSGRSRYRFEGLLAGGRTDQDVADAPPVHGAKLLTKSLAHGETGSLWVDTTD